MSSSDAIKVAVERLQTRIDHAIGSSNLVVIKGVIYDARHFKPRDKLGYERPLQHLEEYAKELAAKNGEDLKLTDTEVDTETDTASLTSDATPASHFTGESDIESGAAAGTPDGRKGVDGISRGYDRAVRALGARLLYVQGKDNQAQLDPLKSLRHSLLQILPHAGEVEQLVARGLRPVALGSALIGDAKEIGGDDQKKVYVMSIRMIKFYMDVDSKAQLGALVEGVQTEYTANTARRDAVRARRKEIEGEKQYPRFQQALALLLQNSELPDDAAFRIDLRKNIEVTLSDIYSQPLPNTERFESLVAEASPLVAAELEQVHAAFIESKQRHDATKTSEYSAVLSELIDMVAEAKQNSNVEFDDDDRANLSRAVRLSVVNGEGQPEAPGQLLSVDTRSTARFENLVSMATPPMLSRLHALRGIFRTALAVIEEAAAKRAANKSWLQNLWVGAKQAGPKKTHVETEDSKEMRRMRKALTRGRRGGLADEADMMSPIAGARQK
jgi:hypothetical protein